MDQFLQMLASTGQGNLSPAQLASALGPENIATLEMIDSSRSLKSKLSQGTWEEDAESFVRRYKQDIEHAKEELEVSRRHLPASRS